MLVALPSAIAFGVTIFSPLGAAYAAQGAIAGVLGTIALGLVAPMFGGADRLITAPCAPAAAVLAALAVGLSQQNVAPETALLMITLVMLMCGGLQVAFGVVRIGRLIKYMPYPVVSGYLSGVGMIIIFSQIPRWLGAPKGMVWWKSLLSPAEWNWFGIAVGAATMAGMVLAPKLTRAVPAAICGLLAGVATYFALGLADRSLWTLEGNALVVGPLASAAGGGFFSALVAKWKAVGTLGAAELPLLITPALTLAVLLSIDALKTCVVVDALTRTRHNSNRVLIGQGAANLASSVIGGIAGAGTMGATLVNLSSGAQTPRSGMIAGALALVAFLVLGSLIAWVPIAALAGILIVIGVRMFDRNSLHLLKARTTALDFVVIVAVVVVAVTVSLIAAAGVGVALAIALFIREQIGGAVVRRRMLGSQIFSKQVRLADEIAILEQRGERTAIFELQGSLFFGTTDQLYTALEADLKTRSYVILDMRRVQSVDFTAAHMLEQFADMLGEHKGYLIFSQLPRTLPSGRDIQQYFDQVGVVRPERHVRVFDSLDQALEWVEDLILEEALLERAMEYPLELRELDLFKGRKEETLTDMEAIVERRIFAAGETLFRRGEPGDELFLIRRGAVRIMLPLDGNVNYHLATFGRGDFFGEMSFLDREPRSADAVAFTDADVFVISRARFDEFVSGHKKLGMQLFEGLARALAIRLRHTNAELRALHDS